MAKKKKKKARRAGARRNPDASLQHELRQAAARYEGFKGEAAKHARRVQLPKPPRVLLTIGDCLGIMYRTRRDGRTENYVHRFAKNSRPILCCSSDGKQLYLLDGAYSVTDRGIEDAP